MTLSRPVSVLLAVVMLAAFALFADRPAARAAAPPKPVINGPVFNDPLGPPAQQQAIFDQTIKLANATPSGEEINVSMYGFGQDWVADSVASALIAAKNRGVRVKIIVDDGSARGTSVPVYNKLRAALGTKDTAASWIVVCDDKWDDPDGVDDTDRGCITRRTYKWKDSRGKWHTERGYNHSKYFLFSKVGPFDDGTSYSNVVMQSSSNISNWYVNESYNDAVTFSNTQVYNAYRQYFADQRRLRYGYGNDNYYRSSPTGTQYRGYFFPRHEAAGEPYGTGSRTDPIVSVLDEVKCTYKGYDGKSHQTDIRIAMLAFTRVAIAKKLAALKRAGCWVDIVFAGTPGQGLSADVKQALTFRGGPKLTACNIRRGQNLNIRPHNKFMLIDGSYNNEIDPRVYTGSHNYAKDALRLNDESMVRIVDPKPGQAGPRYHAAYLSYFYKMRKACGG